MKKKSSLLVFIWVIIISGGFPGCDPQKDYYARPEFLAPPIYQQLQDSGVFTRYLYCVDKSGYDKTLKGAGYYTVFAPTDEAFTKFLAENGFASVEEIPAELATKIVTYSMCVSAASYQQIDDFQTSSALVTPENKTDLAFKRTTLNYKWVYSDFDHVAQVTRDVIDMNAVESEVSVRGNFELDDYNQKNIPVFTSSFMAKKNLLAADYKYFYPNAELTDFNVSDARVVKRDLWAENGIIHVVDRVIVPLDNLEEILAKTDECGEFRDLLNRYMVSYTLAGEAFQLKYEQSSGIRKEVYIKDYPQASFALNCENFLKFGGGSEMDAQIDGWTLFAPSDEAMTKFYNDKFFRFGYNSLSEMPAFVIQEFVNAHLFRTTVWPSKFAITTNPYGEEARFDANADVIKAKIGSNGIFYVVNHVQNTNAFNTVLGDIILNPDYSLMYQALYDLEPLIATLKNPISSYLLFLVTNDQMTKAGFKYNPASLAWEFTDDPNRPDLGTHPRTALSRFIYMHIVLQNVEMMADGVDLINGTGVLKTYGDEYIKYNKGEISAGGNPPAQRPRITSAIDSKPENGRSYTLDKPLLFSNGNIGEILSVSSLTSRLRATTLLRYLEKIAAANYVNDDGETVYVPDCIFNATTRAIKDIPNTDVITVFLPNDPAMTSAANSGVLKPLASFAPNGNENVLGEDNMALGQFLKYHIVKGNIPVGESSVGEYTTYRKLDDGTYATLFVNCAKGNPGSITITDEKGRTANVITSSTTTYNILGNRAIVHVIDNYLTY